MTKIAALQMTSGENVARNMQMMGILIQMAARRGAKVIVAPEGAPYMGPNILTSAAVDGIEHPGVVMTELQKWAVNFQVDIISGIWEATTLSDKVYNTCVHISPQGKVSAKYRKIHLFDARLQDGNVYDESKNIQAGSEIVTTRTACGVVGLSVCYDVRFPELYRALSKKGADVLAVPAAFTVVTGREHWHVLLRARAIENQAYVVAPAQVGKHYGSRASYGHALVCDGWGHICAEATSEKEEVVIADVDIEHLKSVREKLPSLRHRKLA